MKVGDVVLAGRNAFRIVGVYLGGVGTQNLVGLESLHKATGYAGNVTVREMFVPEELVLTAGVYRLVDGEESHSFHQMCGSWHQAGQCPAMPAQA